MQKSEYVEVLESKDNNVREKSDTKTEIASWQTSKGEVVPVYEDFNRQGTDYKLALY